MQPLNFSRQCKKSILEQGIQDDQRYLWTIDNSVKFSLPMGGQILRDKEYKAISDIEEVRLPFQCIALEFEYDEPELPKVIIFATEVIEDGKRYIHEVSAVYSKSRGVWIFFPEIYIPTVGTFGPDGESGWKSVAITPSKGALDEARKGLSPEHWYTEVKVLMGFLNALACSNTEIDKIPARKRKKSTKGRALPFDEYHCLVLKRNEICNSPGSNVYGDRRTPREHVRRGHIRRYGDGKCIWVNSTIVAAGSAGKVSKEYALA